MNAKYIINSWKMDADSSSLINEESHEPRKLGEFQFRLLQIMADNAGKILSREELNSKVWEKRVIGNNSLPNAIHALRAALDDNGKQKSIIKTIPKKGYMLEASYCKSQTTENEATLANGQQIFIEPSQKKDTVTSDKVQAEAIASPIALVNKYRLSKLWQRLFLAQMTLVIFLSAALVKSLNHETTKPEVGSQNLVDNINMLRFLPGASDNPYDKFHHPLAREASTTKQQIQGGSQANRDLALNPLSK